jgi:TPR repeat protein
MLQLGDGIVANKSLAAHYDKFAADRGHKLAQFNVSAILSSGDGIMANKSLAVQYLHNSANRGYAPAMGMESLKTDHLVYILISSPLTKVTPLPSATMDLFSAKVMGLQHINQELLSITNERLISGMQERKSFRVTCFLTAMVLRRIICLLLITVSDSLTVR